MFRHYGISFYAYSPLAGGLLTGKYKYEQGPNLINLSQIAELLTAGSNSEPPSLRSLIPVILKINNLNLLSIVQRPLQFIKFGPRRRINLFQQDGLMVQVGTRCTRTDTGKRNILRKWRSSRFCWLKPTQRNRCHIIYFFCMGKYILNILKNLGKMKNLPSCNFSPYEIF